MKFWNEFASSTELPGTNGWMPGNLVRRKNSFWKAAFPLMKRLRMLAILGKTSKRASEPG